MQLTMQVIWTNQFTWYFGSSPQCGFHIPFRCSLEVNFTVEGWGMVFPCYGRQASDFFKASKPLCLTAVHRPLLLDPIPPPPPLSACATCIGRENKFEAFLLSGDPSQLPGSLAAAARDRAAVGGFLLNQSKRKDISRWTSISERRKTKKITWRVDGAG